MAATASTFAVSNRPYPVRHSAGRPCAAAARPRRARTRPRPRPPRARPARSGGPAAPRPARRAAPPAGPPGRRPRWRPPSTWTASVTTAKPRAGVVQGCPAMLPSTISAVARAAVASGGEAADQRSEASAAPVGGGARPAGRPRRSPGRWRPPPATARCARSACRPPRRRPGRGWRASPRPVAWATCAHVASTTPDAASRAAADTSGRSRRTAGSVAVPAGDRHREDQTADAHEQAGERQPAPDRTGEPGRRGGAGVGRGGSGALADVEDERTADRVAVLGDDPPADRVGAPVRAVEAGRRPRARRPPAWPEPSSRSPSGPITSTPPSPSSTGSSKTRRTSLRRRTSTSWSASGLRRTAARRGRRPGPRPPRRRRARRAHRRAGRTRPERPARAGPVPCAVVAWKASLIGASALSQTGPTVRPAR